MFGLTPWNKDRNSSTALTNRNEHPFALFRNEFDNLFDRFFNGWPGLEGGWGLDGEETENAVKFSMDAPGFEPGDFDIQVSGDVLRVTAERKTENGKGRSSRRFERSVTLPTVVAADKVEANYRNGVLELNLPKTEQAKWKKIAVKGG
jgi:HSP20 family protein